jgi:adenylate cyclase
MEEQSSAYKRARSAQLCNLSPTAHCLLLISFESADAGRNVLMYPWRTRIGTGLLLIAVLVHYANALWSIYFRRSLRLSPWQWAQISLGLCIPILLMSHVVGTTHCGERAGRQQ